MNSKKYSGQPRLSNAKFNIEYKGRNYQVTCEQYKPLSIAVEKFMKILPKKPANIRILFSKKDITDQQNSFIGILFNNKETINIKIEETAKKPKVKKEVKAVPKDPSMVCSRCEEENASKFCRDCGLGLCEECEKLTNHTGHKVLSFDQNNMVQYLTEYIKDVQENINEFPKLFKEEENSDKLKEVQDNELIDKLSHCFDCINSYKGEFITVDGNSPVSEEIYSIQFLQRTYSEELDVILNDIYQNYTKKKKKMNDDEFIELYESIQKKEKDWNLSKERFVKFNKFCLNNDKVVRLYKEIDNAINEVFDEETGKLRIENEYSDFFEEINKK